MSNEEQKIAELENDPVTKLLGGLKRIEAPGDFDFRVKARIASGRPVDKSASWLPATVWVAVPLGLILVVGGYFGYNGLNSPNTVAVAPVIAPPTSLPLSDIKIPEPVSVPDTEMIASTTDVKPPVLDGEGITKPTEKRTASSVPVIREPGGGSRDIASGISKPLTAKDPDPESNTSPKSINTSDDAPARGSLSSMGVIADPSGKISSVRPNSAADRAGLKAGDVIESMNGNSLHIRRGGMSMQIRLKP